MNISTNVSNKDVKANADVSTHSNVLTEKSRWGYYHAQYTEDYRRRGASRVTKH